MNSKDMDKFLESLLDPSPTAAGAKSSDKKNFFPTEQQIIEHHIGTVSDQLHKDPKYATRHFVTLQGPVELTKVGPILLREMSKVPGLEMLQLIELYPGTDFNIGILVFSLNDKFAGLQHSSLHHYEEVVANFGRELNATIAADITHRDMNNGDTYMMEMTTKVVRYHGILTKLRHSGAIKDHQHQAPPWQGEDDDEASD